MASTAGATRVQYQQYLHNPVVSQAPSVNLSSVRPTDAPRAQALTVIHLVLFVADPLV